MKKFFLIFLLMISAILCANSAPVVSNVSALQRDDGSLMMDVYYDVYDADGDEMTIIMQVSDDNGTTWAMSCNLASGDIGSGQSSGTGKHIVWNVGSEHPNMQGDDFRFKIIASNSLNPVIDYDGNVYQTVIIGDQEWMAENLKVTHYRNGAAITNVTNDDTWAGLSSGAYCYYDNDPSNADTYGALYNWYTVDDSRGLAPDGWHIPTDTELTELTTYLGSNAGSKLAGGYELWSAGDLRNNTEFGNSGFDFLPGGYRYGSNGFFYDLSLSGHFWSSTEYSSDNAWYRSLAYHGTAVSRSYIGKQDGFSVRCIRD